MKLPSATPILFVDNTFTFGGAINALEYLLRSMDRSRFEPIVLSAQSSTFLQDRFAGITWYQWPVKLQWVHNRVHLRMRSLPGFHKGPLRKSWDKSRAAAWLVFYELPEALRIAKLARRHGVKLIHLNNALNGMIPAFLAGKILGVPIIGHARGAVTTTGLARTYAQSVTHWISVSDYITGSLRAAGVDPQKITVIHDAVDLSRFEGGPPRKPIRSELGIPVDAPIFGIFGRIIAWKGIKEFILAAHRVIAAVPEAVGIVVGDRSDGEEAYCDEVVALAKDLGIADQIVFTGFREDVGDMMRLCDVVVHASIIGEPFGMTVIEGMATATPVVAANEGGPTEIIESGVTGLLVDPRNAEELSNAIISLLRDPELAARIGSQGAARARAHYSAERYAADVERLYEQWLPTPGLP